jgi:hypothetical protein
LPVRDRFVVMAQGTVTDLVRDAMIVRLDCSPQLRAPLSGRMRTNKVRVVAVCRAELLRQPRKFCSLNKVFVY